MTEFNGTSFQYNPAITNVNIDNQLTGILSQFNDDYFMDVIKDSLNDRVRLYSLPRPNVVASYESIFKQLTDGFSSNTDEILTARKRVYTNIINVICDYYGLTFIDSDETDYYSIAYWLYDFFISKFIENLKNFYAIYLIKEREPICNALDLLQYRKENDTVYTYSKKLFKDTKLAAIHSNLEYVITQISAFNIDLNTILNCVYGNTENLPLYIGNIVNDPTGTFFNNFYQNYVLNSRDSADILTYIKLALQQYGGEIESV